MDKETREDIRLIRGAQAAQQRTKVAELTEQVKQLEERIENQKHTHSLGLNEVELASVINGQIREALPPFIDDILEGEMSHKIAAVNEFSEKLGEIIAGAIAFALENAEG